MSFSGSALRYALVTLTCSSVVSTAWALRTHTGWCIGVGNKHSASACTAGTPQQVTPPGDVPNVNQGPGVQASALNGPTPGVVTLPVLVPVTEVQLQRPELPQTQTLNPQVTLQVVLRPRPVGVARPPVPMNTGTPGASQAGPEPVVLQPPLPVVTVNPPLPLATVQTPVTNQLVPQLQPPQPAVVPPQVAQVPQPTAQDGTVVITPQPQQPVVTVNPPQPPVQAPSPASTQTVPLIPPRPLASTLPVPSWIVTGDGKPRPPVKPPIFTPQVPQQGAVTTTDAKPDSGGSAWVVRLPGRQPPHALPTRFDVSYGQALVQCVVSGFGWRKQARAEGGWDLVGFHPSLRITEILVRDIPANHHTHAGCVLEVVRRQAEGG